MRVRLPVILLLLLALATTIAGQQPVVNDDPSPARQEEEKLTPEEEREALELVARFNERLRATNDFGQIVDELFVSNVGERLRRAPQDSLPLALLDKSLVGSASPDELKRYYIALMNLYQLFFSLDEVVERIRKQSDTNEDDLWFEAVLHTELSNVLRGNSITAALFKEDQGDEHKKESSNNGQLAEDGDSAPSVPTTPKDDAGGTEEESEIGIIKSLSQLNDVSATLEKANELMRRHLAYMTFVAPAVSDDSDGESEDDSPKTNLTILNEGQFGYPQGTRVIHLDASPYCLQLIRVDGRLRILSASMYVD